MNASTPSAGDGLECGIHFALEVVSLPPVIVTLCAQSLVVAVITGQESRRQGSWLVPVTLFTSGFAIVAWWLALPWALLAWCGGFSIGEPPPDRDVMDRLWSAASVLLSAPIIVYATGITGSVVGLVCARALPPPRQPPPRPSAPGDAWWRDRR